jgi:GAF domain-containing protein
MIDNKIQSSFNLPEWRENFILNLLRVSCLLGIVFIIGSSDRIAFILLYIVLLAITFIPIPYFIRALASIAIPLMIGVNLHLTWGPWGNSGLFFLIGIALGSLLFDKYVDLAIFIFATLFISAVAFLNINGLYQLNATTPPVNIIVWRSSIIEFFALGVILVIALSQFKNVFLQVIFQIQNILAELSATTAEKIKLEKTVLQLNEEFETRMTQLHAATTAARSIAEIQDITELLEYATKLISEKFGYYHTGLFILDEQKKNAFLQSASSTRGKELIGEVINLETNKKNPLSLAVEQNRAIINLDVDSKNFVPEENFPLTRSRMALPFSIRGDVIGVLDLHSDQPRAFNVEDTELLQALTDLIAIAFDNVRLINETQNLVNQLQANTSIQTQRTWRKLTSRQMPAYQYTPAGVRPIFNSNKRSDDGEGLRVPLILYGQTIGSIKLKRKNTQAEWSEKEKALIEKIAEQVSLALENSRLVEEAQKSALRDQMVANVSTRIRETLDIESVARTAAAELQRVFDLKEAEVVIGSQFEKQDGKF